MSSKKFSAESVPRCLGDLGQPQKPWEAWPDPFQGLIDFGWYPAYTQDVPRSSALLSNTDATLHPEIRAALYLETRKELTQVPDPPA